MPEDDVPIKNEGAIPGQRDPVGSMPWLNYDFQTKVAQGALDRVLFQDRPRAPITPAIDTNSENLPAQRPAGAVMALPEREKYISSREKQAIPFTAEDTAKLYGTPSATAALPDYGRGRETARPLPAVDTSSIEGIFKGIQDLLPYVAEGARGRTEERRRALDIRERESGALAGYHEAETRLLPEKFAEQKKVWESEIKGHLAQAGFNEARAQAMKDTISKNPFFAPIMQAARVPEMDQFGISTGKTVFDPKLYNQIAPNFGLPAIPEQRSVARKPSLDEFKQFVKGKGVKASDEEIQKAYRERYETAIPKGTGLEQAIMEESD
jgi:hypothetical protein